MPTCKLASLALLCLFCVAAIPASLPVPAADEKTDDNVVRFSRFTRSWNHGPINCARHPDALDCVQQRMLRRVGGNEPCTYIVTLSSDLFPEEKHTMCARPREALPCRMTGDARCVVPPMEMSKFDLMILYIINHELQARIIRLQSQREANHALNEDLQTEIQLIIADNLAWVCALKCDNGSCDFGADLEPHGRSVGGIPRMTSLVTDYPPYPMNTKRQHVRIDMPVGSFEISRLLKNTKEPFQHMAVASLPLTVSCLKN